MYLNYLEPETVGERFAMDLAFIHPSKAKVQTFCDFLVCAYILIMVLIFHSEIWAINSSSMYLTANACESCHVKFNSLFL